MSLFQLFPFFIISSSLFFSLSSNERGEQKRVQIPADLARELVLLAITRSPQPAADLCLPGHETWPGCVLTPSVRGPGAERGKGKGREINRPRWYSNTSVT